MITLEKQKKLDQEATMRAIYKLKVYVIGGGYQYIKMFFDAGFTGARNVEEADIVCFTGGEDVDPSFYGEKAIKGTCYNTRRDEIEAGLFGEAMALKKPMVGICRGAQFLNVMNEGKLWQDVNNHANGMNHPVKDSKTGKIMHNMTSTHHQQMIAGPKALVLAVANLSTRKDSESQQVLIENPSEWDDMEALWYEDSLSLCFQPHPEFNHGECRDYFLELFDEYILPAC